MSAAVDSETFPVASIRAQFPALARIIDDQPAVYLDGPAGTQVPQSVADAISSTILHHNANTHGHFVTSHEADQVLEAAWQAAADLVGAKNPREIVYGPNMTTLTLHFSRAISQTWQAGDNILVTRMDHDANFRPWALAAEDKGVECRVVDLNPEDVTLDFSSLEQQLDERTRLVAVTAASNAVGSRVPLQQVVEKAHAVGALVYVDAVHYAPHETIDVEAIGCDFLTCSTYKFFGPHIGIVWGRSELLESIKPYKLKTSPETIPENWMTGTANFACLAGATAAIDYLAGLHSQTNLPRRERLLQSFKSIKTYEQQLAKRLISGLVAIPGGKVHGVTDLDRLEERVPTIAFTHANKTAGELAAELGKQQIFAWSGNYYALELTTRLGLEPEGMLRLGLMHYNTVEEVDRTLEALVRICKQ